MFNYKILDGEIIDENYTFINVEFSNGIETFINEYSLTNDTKTFDLETLKITQFISFSELLDEIYTECGSIYNEKGEINYVKNKLN